MIRGFNVFDLDNDMDWIKYFVGDCLWLFDCFNFFWVLVGDGIVFLIDD